MTDRFPSAPIRQALDDFLTRFDGNTLDGWRLIADRMGYTDAKSAQGTVPRLLARDYLESGRVDFDPVAWVDSLLVAIDASHLWALLDEDFRSPDLATDDEHDRTCGECGCSIDWAAGDLAVRVERKLRGRWAWWSLCALCWAGGSPRRRAPDCTGVLRARRLPDELLLELYREYVTTGVGVLTIAERLYAEHGFASANSAERAITAAWHAWGWPLRDRATAKRSSAQARRNAGVMAGRIPAADLRKLHVLHTKGDRFSALELARRTYDSYGYRSALSCHRAILAGWKQLGLKARDRIEMTVAMSTKNGLSPRDWQTRKRLRLEAGLTMKAKERRPLCLGTSKHGGRCVRPSMPSGYCYSHDPARAGERNTNLERMRAASPLHTRDYIPFADIQDELVAAYEWCGSWEPLASALGRSAETLKTYATPARRGGRCSVERAQKIRAAIAAVTAPTLGVAA